MSAADPISQILTTSDDKRQSFLEDLRGADEPVVLYGAGQTARHVYAWLREEGVPLHAVAVDRPTSDGATFGDHRLLPLDELAAEGRRFLFVLGFVPVNDDLAAIGRRLEAKVPGRLRSLDFSAFSFGAASPEFLQANLDQLRAFRGMLADDLSRETLVRYLRARLTFDADGLDEVFRGDQYFPAEVVSLGSDEHFIDAGAYDGDTVLQFVERTGARFGSIRAFEPDPVNFRKLQKAVSDRGLAHCDLRNAGTWERTGELAFHGSDARLSTLDNQGDVRVRVEAIDDVVGDGPVSFIKMDVEGAELASLNGARRSIERHAPRMAICMYHRPEDLVTIPPWICRALPGARLFLRLHTRHSQELVLYAVP